MKENTGLKNADTQSTKFEQIEIKIRRKRMINYLRDNYLNLSSRAI